MYLNFSHRYCDRVHAFMEIGFGMLNCGSISHFYSTSRSQVSSRMTMNVTRFIPIYVLSRHMAKTTSVEKKVIEDGTKIASEAIANIRTVASLRKFSVEIKCSNKNEMKLIRRPGATYDCQVHR